MHKLQTPLPPNTIHVSIHVDNGKNTNDLAHKPAIKLSINTGKLLRSNASYLPLSPSANNTHSISVRPKKKTSYRGIFVSLYVTIF